MPKGVYNRSENGVAMNKEELAEVEAKAEGKKSPLPPPSAAAAVPVPGTHRVRVGNFTKPALVGHAGTLRDFAKIEHDFEGWIPMTLEQAKHYEAKEVLVGFDGEKELGLIKINNGRRK